ncbi:ankyrin, partial [Gautieria morchelliformis]
MFRPSDQFETAAAFLSTSPALSTVSNDVKLELYALYKCITVSKKPTTPRPSLFDFAGRAKWDAWDKLGQQSDEPQALVWEQRYLEIARSLGWQEGIQPRPESLDTGSTPAKSSDGGSEENKAQASGGGMGVAVSTMAQPPVNAKDHGTLHGFALSNDVQGLAGFLDAHSEINLDFLDEYGYTALHLAADRGSASVVQVLLERGADASIKDSDEFTALALAEVGGHDDIAKTIRGHKPAG